MLRYSHDIDGIDLTLEALVGELTNQVVAMTGVNLGSKRHSPKAASNNSASQPVARKSESLSSPRQDCRKIRPTRFALRVELRATTVRVTDNRCSKNVFTMHGLGQHSKRHLRA
jgi:hypothetical protein